MLTSSCNSFTVKKINFTAADQPATPGIGLSQPFTDKGAQTSLNLIFQSTSTLQGGPSPAAHLCAQRDPRGDHLWHQDVTRSPQSRGTCPWPWCTQGIPRALEEGGGCCWKHPRPDNTPKAQSLHVLYLIPARVQQCSVGWGNKRQAKSDWHRTATDQSH